MSQLSDNIANLQKQAQEIEVQQYLALEKAMKSDDPKAIITANKMWHDTDERRKSQLKSYIIDPNDARESNGYTSKRMPMSYYTLRRMAKSPIIRGIIGARIEQVADFTKPQPDKYSTGFVIRRKRTLFGEQEEEVSKQDQKVIEYLTNFILNCGDQANAWHVDRDWETAGS